MDQATSHGLVGRPGECLLYTPFQHLAAGDDFLDVRQRTIRGVLGEGVPVAVVGDEARRVGRYLLVQHGLHGRRQGSQRLALLHRRDSIEGVDVFGMNGEQADVLVQGFVHPPIKPGEVREVFSHLGVLLTGLAQEPLGDDELHVAPGDQHLLETVLDPPQIVGDERESLAVEDRLLYAGDEAQPEVAARLAEFAQEVEVEDEVLVPSRAEVVQQFVDDEEQAVVGIQLVKRRHHFLEAALVVRHLVGGGERVTDLHRRQAGLEFGGKNVAERHRG